MDRNNNDYSKIGNSVPLLPQTHWQSRDRPGDYQHLEGRNAAYHSGSQDPGPHNTIPRKPPLLDASVGRLGPMGFVDSNAGFDGPKQLPRSSTGKTRSIGLLQEWWLEILRVLLALAALFAILATVYPYNGHPLPEWPYGLSINSLISIYIVMLKAAMLLVVTQGISQLKWTWFRQTRPLVELEKYDNASRGILGAANLLWMLRGRHLVSSIGATIILLAIAVDPFAQQIVRYYTCTGALETAPAVIPRVNSYVDPQFFHDGAGSEVLGIGTQAAVQAGLFAPATISIPYNCATGNCSFPNEYHSLGYCSSCTDISEHVKVVNRSVPTGANTTFTTLGFELPSGLFSSLYMAGAMIMAPIPSNSYSSFDSTSELLFGMSNDTKLEDCSPDDPLLCRGYGAARCSMHPCVRTLTAGVLGGNLTEKTTSSASTFGMNGDALNSVDMACISDIQKQSLRRVGYKFNDDAKWLAYNVTALSDGTFSNSGYSEVSNETLSIVPAKCIYSFDRVTNIAVAGYLYSFFNGTVNYGPEVFYGSSTAMLQLFENGNLSFSNVASNFANISEALTNYMRQHPVANSSDPVLGTAQYNQTCVHVRWAWMAYPAVLVLAMLVFFAAMVIETRVQDEVSNHDFKSSVLPLMFHGLETERTLDLYGESMGRVWTMSADARRIWVRLSRTDKGWKFVEVDQGEVTGIGES